jgi:hypothetical protein
MRTLYTIGGAALCCAVLGAAQSADESKPPEFGVRGRVEKIAPPPSSGPRKDEILGYVTVSGKKEADTETDRAVVLVLKTTRIQRRAEPKPRPVPFSELKVGQRIEARFQPGPRILIYPPRAAATEITILGGPAVPAARSLRPAR